MCDHDSSLSGPTASKTQTRVLKDQLHLEFLRYLDLFFILFLILNKKIKIYNCKSRKTLIDKLNAVFGSNLTASSKSRECVTEDVRKSTWYDVVERFEENMGKKFNFRVKKGVKLEPLSFSQFEEFTESLGREPFGLYSVLKRRVGKFKSGEMKEVKREIENGLYDYKHEENKESVSVEGEELVVGVVSPFVLSSHKEYLEDFEPAKKKKKTTSNENLKKIFQINEELYSKSKYPLETMFNKVETENESNEESVYHSHRLCDTVFEIASLVLEGKQLEKKEENVISVVELIRENMDSEWSEEEEVGEEVFSQKVVSRIVENKRELLKKIGKLKPFPTTYWLIHKGLVKKVSALEGEGLIKVIQSIIDSIVEEYDKTKDKKNENILKSIIKDNLYYMLKRFKLTHPEIVELMYNIVFNSNLFPGEEGNREEEYINLKGSEGDGIKKKKEKNNEFYKAISIINTLRTQGISGSKGFLHIKCLHTLLGFHMAEGSIIGESVSNLIF